MRFFLLLRLQIVLIMWSKRSKSSRRRCHSPLNRREVPTPPQATEETHLVASPASSWVETTIFHSNAFLFFKDKNPPHHSLPPHHSVTFCQPSPTSHALPLSHPWTPVSSPSTLEPFVWILFSIKIRKLLTKALYVSLPLPSPFPFQPIL